MEETVQPTVDEHLEGDLHYLLDMRRELEAAWTEYRAKTALLFLEEYFELAEKIVAASILRDAIVLEDRSR